MNNKTKFKYQKVNFTHFILNLSLNTVFHNCERARDESRSNRERKRDARRGGASCSKHSHPFEKARLGDSVASKWLQGTITRPYNPSQDLPVSDRPARLTNVKLVSPSLMPKLGKAGSLQSRQAIVHSLVHTESWAIDLSWARGLDVLPTTISRFRNGGDDDTADLLERVVYPEEITHCAAGVKWFKYLCLRSRNPSLYQDILALEESEAGRSETQMDKESEEVIQKFHAIVRTHFRGPLKPPFNESKESCWLRPSVV
ncbi:hypothetical protein ERO13_D10G207500v2 [Gossypium hirsutum]|nr:hypothetical protein ERO13_D10G207500v2 [Gossypium hirsutum]